MDNNLPTEFDLIVAGTGVVESIISAAASRIGKRVLHVDNKSYYGGHWASFNLEDFQNLATNDILKKETALFEGLGKTGELFLEFGNNLSNLRGFQTNWHVEEKLPLELDDTKTGEPKEKNELHETEDDKNERTSVGNSSCNTSEEKSGLNESAEQSKLEIDKSKHFTQESLRRDYRKFIIDLCPKLHFARGDFVELLISSNIARYSEFRSVSRVLTWINRSVEVVPCSRSDVFANNKVSVVEKRMLMKLLTSIDEEEKNSIVPASTTYKSMLKSKKLSDNLIHFVLYALSMSTDETVWLDGLRRTKRFLHSLGRFGKTPFLFSMYGSGEVTQAFCRLSAVFGGVFALNQPLHGFLINSENIFQAIICGKQRITAPHLVTTVGMVTPHFLEESEVGLITRAVFITDKSLMNSEREHLTLLLYPLRNNNLCRILELGTLTGTCPKNLFLVHLTASGTSNPKEDLQECVDNLFATDENDTSKPRIIWSSYFSIPDTNTQKFKDTLPKNIFPCPGPDADLDYDFSVKKAKEIFSSLYPDEEFLPRAPDAEEIVIEEEPEAASEAKVSSDKTVNPSDVELDSELQSIKESYTEMAVEAKASNSELTDYEANKEVEECTEVKETAE